MDAVSKLQLELTIDDVKWAIVAARKLKIKQEVCFLALIPTIRLNRLVDHRCSEQESVESLR